MVPVRNEERDLAPSVRRLVGYLRDELPVHRPGHDRGQRQHRRHLGDRAAAGPRATGEVRAVHLELPGPRPGAAGHLVGERRRGPRLHGRRPVHGPERAAAAGRAAAVRAQRRGHRHPAGARLAGDPRAQARDHLPLLQPAAAGHARRRGSPTRSAGSRRSARDAGPGAAAARRRTPAGSSTPSCSCSPSGPGCASTRSRWTGSTTRTRGSTSSPPRSPTCAACAARLGRLRTRDDHGAAAAGPGAWPGRSAGPPGRGLRLAARQVHRDRRGQHGRVRAAVPAAAAASCRPRRPTCVSLLVTAVANTAANRRLTFGISGRAGRGPAPVQGPDRVRHRAGAHLGGAGRAARGVAVAGPRPRSSVLVAANLVATVLRFAAVPDLGVRRTARWQHAVRDLPRLRRALPSVRTAAMATSVEIDDHGSTR